MHGAHTAYIRLLVWSLTVANARSTHKSAFPTQSLLQKQHKTDRNPAIQTTAHTKKRLTLSIAHSTMKLLRFHNSTQCVPHKSTTLIASQKARLPAYCNSHNEALCFFHAFSHTIDSARSHFARSVSKDRQYETRKDTQTQ